MYPSRGWSSYEKMAFKVLKTTFAQWPKLSRYSPSSCSFCTTSRLFDTRPKDSFHLNNNNTATTNNNRQTDQQVHGKRPRDETRKHAMFQNGSSQKTSISPNTSSIKSPPRYSADDKRDEKSNNSTISACTKALSNLLERRNTFPVSPTASWIHHETALKHFNYYDSSPPSNHHPQSLLPSMMEYIESRVKLYKDVLNLVYAIQLSKKTGRIRVLSGKDIQSLSMILGQCLVLCSETPPSHYIAQVLPHLLLPKTPLDAAMDILLTLRELNLNIQPQHYAATIRIACQEEQFQQAATLFLHQIDPEHEGYSPMDSDIGWDTPMEMGLYAIAMSCVVMKNHSRVGHEHEKEVAIQATERVFDAVSKMCLVSARDQEKYILAAGSALGRASLWEGIVLFHDSMENRSKFGQPLVAASMYACVLSGQYDIAVFLYYSLQKDITKMGMEWQWGGQYEGIHPFCRELFLRAAGKFCTDMEYERYAEDSLAIYNDIIANGGNLSPTSLYGLFQTLQRSGQYLVSFDILRKIMSHTSDDTNWSITNESAENFLQTEQKGSPVKLSGMDVVDGKIVAAVMSSCLKSREIGLALLIGQVITGTKRSEDMDLTMTSLDEATYRSDRHVAALISSDIHTWNSSEEYSKVAMDCFKELKCQGVVDILKSTQIMTESLAKDTQDESPSPSANTSWLEAFSHIHYLSRKLHTLQKGNHQLDKLQSYHLFKTLAAMMECCTDAGQPRAGIHLTELFAQYWKQKEEAQPKFLSLISNTLFGKNESRNSTVPHESYKAMLDFTSSSDALLHATVRAYEKCDGIDPALDFYFSSQQKASRSTSLSSVKQVFQINSANYALSLLIRCGRIDDAITLYKCIPEEERIRETYSLIAQAYANIGKWDEVSSLYNYTRDKGLLTETIGLLAMKGVERSVMDGKVRAIRSIASDLALVSGEQSDKWIASRYWTLKKYVGFHYARLLMWWRDPHNTQRNELALAIRYLKEHSVRGTSMNDDALRVIVKFIAERYNQTNEERDRRFAVETILESLQVANNTMLATDSAFISEAALTLQQLREVHESYNILMSAIDRGVEVDKNVVTKVMEKYDSFNLNNQ